MPRPVVFVPGLPASELFRGSADRERVFLRLPPPVEQLLGPEDLDAVDDIVAGDPLPRVKIGFLDLAKFASSLYRVLDDLGVPHVERVGWDWRRPIWDSRSGQVLDRIAGGIERAFELGGPVVLVAHSTGGLALRWFLESAPVSWRPKIAAVAAFGVPWVGTLDSFEALVREKGFPFTSKADVQRMIGHSWAAFDLLPPDPARTVDAVYRRARLVVGPARNLEGELVVSSPLVERTWIDRHAAAGPLREAMERRRQAAADRLGSREPNPSGLFAELPIASFAGWGLPTWRQAILGEDGEVELTTRIDGEDAGLDDGDGTIPRVSAAWLRGPDVRRFHVPIGHYPKAGKLPHARLWGNPGAVSVLAAVLDDRPVPPVAEAAMDWSDFVETSHDVVTVRCQASGSDGEVPSGARVRLRLGSQVTSWQEIDPAFGGRHRLLVARDAVPPAGGEFRRLEVEIDLALGEDPKRIPLLCRR